MYTRFAQINQGGRAASALLLPCAMLLAALPAAAAKVDGYNYVVADQLERALDLSIPRFVLDASDALRFVEEFRHATGIALCVEVNPLFPVAGEERESGGSDDAVSSADERVTPAESAPVVELRDTTPRAILDAFVAARPDYTWLHAGGNRVNLLPSAFVQAEDWRGHYVSGTWDSLDAGIADYFRKLAAVSLKSTLPLTTSTETHFVQPMWANHPRLLQNRRATILNRDATLLEALNAVGAYGPDVVWLLDGPYYRYEAIPLDEVYHGAYRAAEDYRKQPDADPAAAIALYQMAFEEAPYADLKIRIAMAIVDVYLGRSMPVAPQPEKAAQMCKLLLEANPKYPYDVTLWQQYITLLYQLGREKDAQWAVRAHCPPGEAAAAYPCVLAKQLVLWMAGLYENPEDQMRYLIGKQNVFPDDPFFNDELDARVYAIQTGIALENRPEHDPYAQFNQFRPQDESGIPPGGEIEPPPPADARNEHTPRRVKR